MMDEGRYEPIANKATFIDQVKRAFSKAIRIAVNLVFTGHFSFRTKVRQQWESDVPYCRPCAVAINTVYRYSNQLNIPLFELSDLTLIKVELLAATRAPVERIKYQ